MQEYHSEPERRFFAEFTLRFFTSFRMTGEGLRMTNGEGLRMTGTQNDPLKGFFNTLSNTQQFGFNTQPSVKRSGYRRRSWVLRGMEGLARPWAREPPRAPAGI